MKYTVDTVRFKERALKCKILILNCEAITMN